MITKTPEERKQACIEDLSLARQAAAGNDDAFSVIVDRYSRLVYNVALRSVSSPEDAADISQDTFLKAWRSIGSFRGDCALSTWLCRIALNCCCDHARSAKRHRVLSLTVREEDEESKVLDIPDTDVTAMPEEELTWEVFAVSYVPTNFNYIQILKDSKVSKTEQITAEQMMSIVKGARDRSEYDYDVEVNEDDKILTLSTCTYKFGKNSNIRFIIMAKLVTEEDTLVETANITLNADKVAAK